MDMEARSPVASLATTLLGLEINRNRGDKLLLDHLDKLGVAATNISGFPVVEQPIADPPAWTRLGDTSSTGAST